MFNKFNNIEPNYKYSAEDEFFINRIRKNLVNSLWDTPYIDNKPDEKIPIYTPKGEYLKTVPRKEIHENPYWHRTVLILVILPSKKTLYIRRPDLPFIRIDPNTFDCFGGHLREKEAYREAAIRELAEELSLSEDLIDTTSLIQFGEKGQFKVPIDDPHFNYEMSTLYLFFLTPKLLEQIKTKEDYGIGIISLFNFVDSLENLVNRYNNDKVRFADGISRILSQEVIVQQISELILKYENFYPETSNITEETVMHSEGDETPIFLLIAKSGGIVGVFHSFRDDLDLPEQEVGSILSALTSFGNEVLDGELEELKLGDKTLLRKMINGNSVYYYFNGFIVSAKQKLTHFVEMMKSTAPIWDALERFNRTGAIRELQKIILTLIEEIF